MNVTFTNLEYLAILDALHQTKCAGEYAKSATAKIEAQMKSIVLDAAIARAIAEAVGS